MDSSLASFVLHVPERRRHGMESVTGDKREHVRRMAEQSSTSAVCWVGQNLSVRCRKVVWETQQWRK